VSSIERSTSVAGTPDEAWAVLADFGSLAMWVPMIQHSCLLSEQTEGIGTVRRVQIARQTLVERVSTWRPGDELSYTIEGLPPMVGTARNTWHITPTDAGCDVTLTTEIDAGRNPVKRFIARKVLERMSTASEFMLAGLAAAVGDTEETR
jgi:carbon monoxide dehydrogenase subunit G